ncbi:M16 family metallopeptidase [Chryseobacterium jejuense]|uniref:Predicted Zn-dependent peptidase n=1 Tax=Chryseobacterium jejuense TaxID=445960 RepID=A0A2X2V7P2_CHRJE|nr:M16 family metallopeptidase [Chryseobacterium jejuense]SDI34286.1 Predicted Zn-dependent peptidase [Chryseobacterium jejuense]SQB26762.1 protease3 [Chryseobacterium jejuense]
MNLLKKLTIATSIAAASSISHAHGQDFQWKEATSNGYKYRYVTNDPASARYYILKNGLTVILSPTDKNPRIQTYITTKAGSKNDPADHTGLAHYLEHMLFKGTNQFGTKDWVKEKPLLDQIDVLYENYNQTKDKAKRKEIYKKIDRISGEASKYAIANEYDKMMAEMGAEDTNAFTSYEQTVYTEDIPANVIDKFLAVQAERFREPILRLFHTELETVYEEKNRVIDNDGDKVFNTMFASLFPNNNYGKQTVIGTIEHLKNPSLNAIREYYNNYYVPNNMAVVMSGDFNPDEVIAKIDKAFSYMKPKAIPEYKVGQERPITIPIVKEVIGPDMENVMLGFRFPGASTKDARLMFLIGKILANGQAGLIDLNLTNKQKLLEASVTPFLLKDYSALLLQGTPTEDQSLEDVKSLLLQEIDKLKKGEFSEDLLQAIINNEKKAIIEQYEEYSSRGAILNQEFIMGVDHKANLEYIDEYSKLTKKDIMDFAAKYLQNNNYVLVYKKLGKDRRTMKISKPTITPISINKEDQSPFIEKIEQIPENPISPVWLNYDKDIAKNKLGNVDILSVKNKDNALFKMYYYFDTEKWNSKILPLAAEYLEYLGTQNKSSESISKEFYQLASSFEMNVGSDETYILLEGLNENFDKTIALFEDLIKNCQTDPTAFDAYKARMKKARANVKQDKDHIAAGLRNYARYGPQNPFNNVLSDAELDALKAEDLIHLLHDLFNFKHKILYYGPKSGNEIAASLIPIHTLPPILKDIPNIKTFVQIPTDKNKVLFAHYDMVQAEVFWVRNGEQYNATITPTISLFNNYFGEGLGSIVSQTIRESKALAYETGSSFQQPDNKEDKDMIMAYVGTQADKFNESTAAMNELLMTLPKSEQLFEATKSGLKKSIASERISQDGIIFSYLKAQRLGNNFDIRKNVYEQAPKLSFADINAFHDKEMKNKNYTYCIVAAQDKVNEADMQKLGEVKKLNLTEIFGY